MCAASPRFDSLSHEVPNMYGLNRLRKNSHSEGHGLPIVPDPDFSPGERVFKPAETLVLEISGFSPSGYFSRNSDISAACKGNSAACEVPRCLDSKNYQDQCRRSSLEAEGGALTRQHCHRVP